ncbi:MAG: NAD-glutamate dehydrogenase [Gammaproteobacteria bacterium]|nr:NAD-glutamate dehydrogenase [Gammaproteobacteria bacterium]
MKDAAIARVALAARSRLTGVQATNAERFARAYFSGVAAEDLAGKTPEDLYGAMLAHWQLARRRQPGTPNIRIYNPIAAEHSWHSPHTVVQIVTDDMPFLVDSVSMELNRHGLTIHLIIHPVMRMRRDSRGELINVTAAKGDGDARAEAIMHFEVDQETDAAALTGLHAHLERVLSDVRAVVDDWIKMRARLYDVMSALETQALPVPEEELTETLALLRWIDNHHFTYIGFRTFDLVEEHGQLTLRNAPGTGLGIFRDSDDAPIPIPIPPRLHGVARAQELLIITKSTARSTVHRPAHLDHIGIKRFDEQGHVIGEWRFQGLYSYLAYSTRASEIPLLKRKVARVLGRADLEPNSHAGKALRNILEQLPRDEMFQAAEDELFDIAIGILHLQERGRLKLFLRRDIYGRFVSALVYAPRDRYNTTLRLRFQEILMEAFEGLSAEFNVQFSDSVLARVYFIIRTPLNSAVEITAAELEARMASALLAWEDRLLAVFYDHLSEARSKDLWQRYRDAFPASYREDFFALAAFRDIEGLQTISASCPLITHLYRLRDAANNMLRFKVFGRHTTLALSDVLPILERMGLRVLAARPYDIHPREAEPCWILDFETTTAPGLDVEVLEVRDIFQDAFTRIVSGRIENDGFNRLVLAAQLNWREIVLLRALCKYLLQTRLPLSQAYMEQTLANNPAIARWLVELFKLRFEPGMPAQPAVDGVKTRIEQTLEAVTSLDEDRILRCFLALMLATLRTNYFQRESTDDDKPYLAFKLDSAEVPELPLPKPMFEIFVYAPWVEGVHLRGGRVARGGIRWSDRREDFRTEVLGLMKAQTVKNAVIVPVGAKGGFVCKNLPPPDDRDAVQQEVIRCYRTFISGLLDVTDNLVDGAVRPPPDTVRHDGDDPYLVVAADKGTASFSDIANEISAQYGFWLGDAFASGGRYGYDHKKMGITARGAWESVERHFRELGLDVRSTPFTAVGVGDMSGDVFGNGMLKWPKTRLLAAFDHRHIFIDPDPDTDLAFAERQRLFALPRSSWSDYSVSAISTGGGVYPRTAKSIALSPQARAALGIQAERLPPSELLRAILRAPVDLFWNGGIGTYVKASAERHSDVGDRGNDGVRVDAGELRCLVIGEGGNLGLTQLARIEFARGGGLINTDAIDNSAGVDCSDHEVNIKILLNRALAKSEIDLEQRNVLLAEMTADVASKVLRENYLQTQAISLAVSQAAELLGDQKRLITQLERERLLNRALEALPSEEEIAKRETAQAGLTRPELAVLLAYSKIRLAHELTGSNIAGDPYFVRELHNYFPANLRARYAQALVDHPLRGEIIVTHLTNDIVNRMGSTFYMLVHERTGNHADDIARAYVAACEIFGARELWAAIEALDGKVVAALQLEMLTAVCRLADRTTVWLLRNRRMPLDIAATAEHFRGGVEVVRTRIPRLLRDHGHEEVELHIAELCDAGVPVELAQHVAGQEIVFATLNVVMVARDTDTLLEVVTDVYFELGFALSFDWLYVCVRDLPVFDYWQRGARGMLRDDLSVELRKLTTDALRLTPDGDSFTQRVDSWLELKQTKLAHYRSVIAELKSAGKPSFAMLSVAVREVRALARDGQINAEDAA